jgi:signal transduction histidine kinase
MTKRSFRIRRVALGQAVIPASLLALVALVGGLVYHTRTLEASHRATAENALRDYASFAAWQFNQRAETHLTETTNMTLHVVHAWLRGSDKPLPPPDTLFRFGDPDACGIGKHARFSFRIDLPGRHALFAGSAPDSAARAELVARFATIAASTQPKGHESNHATQLMIDSIAGLPRAIVFGVVFGPNSQPRAVYGVDADPAKLVSEFGDIIRSRALLPPSLLRGKPTDSVLMVQLRRADGGLLATIGSASDERFASELPMKASVGGLVTRVVARPEEASLLLIGGMPTAKTNALTLLLVGSIVLAGIALLQLRRGRELTRLRTRFVANVSHELRTPLAQISMFSETLLLGRARSADEGQQFLSVIFREARRLSHLVESVLQFSRSEATPGEARLRLEAHDVSLEVSDAVRAFTPLAAAAGVDVRTTLREGNLARIDTGAIRQVVVNLLDNAVKFGPEKQRVTVTVDRIAGDVVVAVTDEGPGIPAAERRKAFLPFAQVASSQSRTTTGAGIGLSVVADLVAAHDGRVWIEDGPNGRGARVSIAIPAIASLRMPTDHGPPLTASREPALSAR